MKMQNQYHDQARVKYMISHARKNNVNIDTDTESSSMTSDSEEDDFMEFNKNPNKKHLVKVDH